MSATRLSYCLVVLLFPVLQKGIDSLVGQRVGGQLLENAEGNGGDIRTDQGRVQDMQGIADAGNDHQANRRQNSVG